MVPRDNALVTYTWVAGQLAAWVPGTEHLQTSAFGLMVHLVLLVLGLRCLWDIPGERLRRKFSNRERWSGETQNERSSG